jgi:hypothetical protein
MSPLEIAIDELLSFVLDLANGPNFPLPRNGAWKDRFDALDRAVWLETCKMGLEGKLPATAGEYLGKTHLPVKKVMFGFFFLRMQDWQKEMLDLRALATVLAAPQYVTLDQAAAIVQRSKRTLEKLADRKKNPLPNPAIQGGGGKPSEWIWSELRPWLQQEYGKVLPERYPSRNSLS